MLTVSEKIEKGVWTGELGGGLILKSSFQNTHSSSHSILGRFRQGGGHLTEWAMVPLRPRAPGPLSRSDSGVDAVVPSDAQGKLSPERPGSGATPLALRVRKRSQVLPGARGSHSSPSLRSTQEWGGYRPSGAHPCSQTRTALTPHHLAPGQGQAGPGPSGQPGRGPLCSFGTRGSSFPAPRSEPLTITVSPSAEPHFNSSPGDRQFPEFFFFFPSKKRAWFLL